MLGLRPFRLSASNTSKCTKRTKTCRRVEMFKWSVK